MNDAGAPTHVPRHGGLWPADGPLLHDTRRCAVAELAEAVSHVLGTAPAAVGATDYGSAREVLDGLWADTVAALEPNGAVVSAAQTAALLDLLRSIKTMNDQLTDEQVLQRDRSFHLVREGLAALREARSTGALLALAPAIVCSLGFDRAIVSRVDEVTWLPETAHVEKDAAWAEQLVAIGRASPQVLDSALVETEMVRRKLPILVHSVQERPSVHRALAEASLSRSYAAAPVILNGKVAGFVHADCYYQRRNLDGGDRQLLAMFAEGMSQTLARTVVLDRIGAFQNELVRVSRVASTSPESDWPSLQVDDGSGGAHAGSPAEADGGWSGDVAEPPARTPMAVDPLLTRREVEVLRHMAAGDTNARIARRLVISEGTVKSHVKHILRKLGAANRAEAVSQWLRAAQQTRR